MADSRGAILSRLRAVPTRGSDHAIPDWVPIRFQDPIAVFRERLEEAGGRFLAVSESTDLADAIGGLPAFRAKSVFSTTDFVPHTATADTPREFATLSFCVLEGAPAVAENGAVWVQPRDARTRSACFLAEHLVLVVRRDAVVHNLHDAYARIEPAAAPFGCWIAGPSKTADIEQSLVIGAHGPVALTVVGY